ncbi:LuxR C-terminal-related transcriptional regulator [Microbacterium keratanolyticum]|uniref:LuxR C-terminal-related transcriptional regulator n=1 Tax=Microbacterium keratanolyticum TaxID=67574 RepID=UPI00363077AA
MALPIRPSRPGPAVRFRPPAPSPGSIRRDRLNASIDEAASLHRLSVVSAPSGFGKTTAVAEWAKTAPNVAWLALTAQDSDPVTLTRGVLDALRVGAQRSDLALRIEDAPIEPSLAYERICQAVDDARRPMTLIVDDAHRAGETWRDGILGLLSEQPPDDLSLVLVGSTLLDITLARERLDGSAGFVGTDALRFTRPEAERLILAEGSHVDPRDVIEETRGWPIAVRLLAIGGAASTPSSGVLVSLGDYIRHHVLATIPAELSRFVLDLSICSEFTREMAEAVAQRDDASVLIDECIRLGLFLDRFDGPTGTVYRWHGVFAKQCAEGGLEVDPQRVREAHLRAAEQLEKNDPEAAISHALRAGSRERARAILLRTWMATVTGGGAEQVERSCITLLRENPRDAGLLFIRACATDVLGNHQLATEMLDRAEAMHVLGGTTEPSEPRDLARLMISDARSEITRARTELREHLVDPQIAEAVDPVTINHLLGWSEILHPVHPTLPMEYFAAAVREQRMVRDAEGLARSLGHLAFGQTWAGRLRLAAATLAEIEADAPAVGSGFAGGSAAAAAGYVAYWEGDAPRAMADFASILRSDSADPSFIAIARMMIAYSSAEAGDVAACRRAAIGIQDIPLDVVHGVPWQVLRETSIALLEESIGNQERALRIARTHARTPDLPVVGVAMAGILRRAGACTEAIETLRALRIFAEVPYVKSSMLITAAVMRRGVGDHQPAHDLCETALAVASTEGILLPFGAKETAIRRLLNEHAHVGTQYEDFIARCLASGVHGSALDALSERERDVFQQLHTARTLPEIASELKVSVNTVKTHQRAIYRKLGVSSRREAVRTSL